MKTDIIVNMIKFDKLQKAFEELKEELNKGDFEGECAHCGKELGDKTDIYVDGKNKFCSDTHMSQYDPPKPAAPKPLTKNMNGSMNPGMHKPNMTTGTSGGQGGMYKDLDGAGGGQDMQVIKFDKNGQWKLDKSAFKTLQHKIENQGHSKDSAAAITASIGRKEIGQKEMTARSKAALNKVDPQENINIPHPQGKAKMANGVNKGDSYLSTDGKNREANPKLRASDLGPGGKVHMVKDEGTNEESNPTKPHNKEKFKVMDPVKEKEEKHAATTGLPYSGKDKDVKKGEECPKCHADPCKCVDKSQMGHIQGNESKGNDENKAPGRGSLSV